MYKLSMKRLIKNQDGVALGYALILLWAVVTISSSFLIISFLENKQAYSHSENIATFYLAQSGAEIAHSAFKKFIEQVNQKAAEKYTWTTLPGVKGYADLLKHGPLGPPGLTNNISFQLNLSAPNDYYIVYGALPIINNIANSSTLQTSVLLSWSDKNGFTMLDSGECYIFSLNYTIVSIAEYKGANPNKSIITGEGTVSIKFSPGSFARFALFTEVQRTPPPGNQEIYFTEITRFDGPVYTNGSMYFRKTPIFYDYVYSKSPYAGFYNEGQPLLLDAIINSPYDVPVFHKGFIRNAPGEVMPSTLSELRKANLKNYVNSPPTNVWYFMPKTNNVLTGGIYIPFHAAIELIAQGTKQTIRTTILTNNNQVAYLDFVIDYATKKTTIINRSNNQIVETINSLPNGTIFAEGQVYSLKGTVHKDSRLTIASKSNVTINGHILYQEDPRLKPEAKNILGILSETGNVVIPNNNAPNNLVVSGTVMAPRGALQVENHSTIQGDRGDLTLLGGVISRYYGVLAEFRYPNLDKHGYGRTYIYDKRMADPNKMPIGFPMTKSLQWTTAREDGQNTIDLIIWKNKR